MTFTAHTAAFPADSELAAAWKLQHVASLASHLRTTSLRLPSIKAHKAVIADFGRTLVGFENDLMHIDSASHYNRPNTLTMHLDFQTCANHLLSIRHHSGVIHGDPAVLQLIERFEQFPLGGYFSYHQRLWFDHIAREQTLSAGTLPAANPSASIVAPLASPPSYIPVSPPEIPSNWIEWVPAPAPVKPEILDTPVVPPSSPVPVATFQSISGLGYPEPILGAVSGTLSPASSAAAHAQHALFYADDSTMAHPQPVIASSQSHNFPSVDGWEELIFGGSVSPITDPDMPALVTAPVSPVSLPSSEPFMMQVDTSACALGIELGNRVVPPPTQPFASSPRPKVSQSPVLEFDFDEVSVNANFHGHVGSSNQRSRRRRGHGGRGRNRNNQPNHHNNRPQTYGSANTSHDQRYVYDHRRAIELVHQCRADIRVATFLEDTFVTSFDIREHELLPRDFFASN
ncbi:hypothetical protein C8J56DRAFT_1052105 [Mycena floridula]|nr:hypothetical protein C8J56DRAFT_1052105 [Mycena floridula]